MSIKVNDQVIPSWAIERQAQSLYEQVARGMQGKPQEVIQLAAIDLAKERMIDQSLMAQESNRRKYQIDPEEVNKGMKRWMRENGGKKAIEKAKHPAIKDRDDLRREILAQLRITDCLRMSHPVTYQLKTRPGSITITGLTCLLAKRWSPLPIFLKRLLLMRNLRMLKKKFFQSAIAYWVGKISSSVCRRNRMTGGMMGI